MQSPLESQGLSLPFLIVQAHSALGESSLAFLAWPIKVCTGTLTNGTMCGMKSGNGTMHGIKSGNGTLHVHSYLSLSLFLLLWILVVTR